MKRLGILISGRGSNFVAIANSIDSGALTGCEIAVVLSNIPEAPGLTAAQKRGIPAQVFASKGVSRAEHDAALIAALQAHQVDFVILAGYMRVLTADFIRAFPNRILNIHPSLLPAFPGLHAQRQALDYGTTVAGCTVHFVDEAVDHGVIILQRTVPVLPGDDEASLSARILAEEHIAYPAALQMVLQGNFSIDRRRFKPIHEN